MSVDLVSSSRAADRAERLVSWIRDRIGTPVLLLSPTRGAGDDLVRKLAASGTSGTPVWAVERRTLEQLAMDLAARRLAERALTPLRGLGVEALVTQCVRAEEEVSKLGYFGPVAQAPGFPRAVSRTLRELRLERVSADELADGEPRARDLGRLLRRFEAELSRHRLADRARVVDAALETVESDGHRLLAPALALLDVWPRLGAELELVAALARRADESFATLPGNDESARLDLVHAFGATFDAESRESDAGQASRSGPETSLERARRLLFDIDGPLDDRDLDESLEFMSAPAEDRECVEIARRIQDLARSGQRFDRMAVLLREVESYLPLLEEALRRAGVPAYFSRGTVRPDTAGRAFLALLSCAAEGLSASRFAEFLSLGEVADRDDSGAPPERDVEWVEPRSDQLVLKTLVPASEARPEPEPSETVPVPARWERLLVDASVVGGRGRWRSRLDGLDAEIELQLREVSDEEEPRRHGLEGRRRQLRSLRAFALPVIDDLDRLPDGGSWGEWIEALERLAVRVLRSPDRVVRLLESLRPMAEVGPVSLQQVQEVLHQRLSFLRDEVKARRWGRVFVGTIPEALGRDFDYVFLPGLAEGLFPRRALEDPLLLDVDRVGLGTSLETKEERLRHERSLLRWTLETATSKLVVSYPRIDRTQGRARVPSFYALDLLRAAQGRLPGLEDLNPSGAEATLNWPAPDDGLLSIDDVEYDLALLAPLLRPGATEVKGKGRFLLDVNDCLDRSLRSRWFRWRASWTRVDGLLEPGEESRRILLDQLPTRRSYSPTALQNLAACPYRFLLHGVHRLHPRDELERLEQIDPLTRGALFHEVQFHFFLAAKDRSWLPLHEDFAEELLRLVDETLERVASDYEDRLAPAIPRIWRSEVEALRMDLRGWVRKLMDDRESWTPVHFEYGFGLHRPAGSGRDPASRSEPAVAEGVQLRGSIDLVERNWKRRSLRVTDHKTGRAPGRKRLVVGGGETLQPVLYALAAEAQLAGEGEVVEGGRLSFCTQRGGYETLDVDLDDEARAAARRVFELVERSLVNGVLPAAPREKACLWCDYRSVCGPYEERRVRRKNPDLLTDLEALRALP